MFELSLMCPEDRVEWLCDALDALDALSVSVEDADAQTDAEQALFGEPGMPAPKEGWLRSRVTALFSQETQAQEASTLLQAQTLFAGCQVLATVAVEDQDWVRLTQSQFAPVEITPEFWIVPTWHEPPAQAQEASTLLQTQALFEGCQVLETVPVEDQDWVRLTQSQFAPVEITPEFWIVPTWHEPPAQARQIIRLDPGLAFGTGTHPTTRMCLRWVAAHPGQARVLDYGCGSGILAIGAAKFGASEVVAVDIDTAAVESTELNASANGVSLLAGLPERATGAFDLVLANILATPLKVLAPLLCAHVAGGGHLVLAGILERQEDELKAAYAPYCRLDVADREDGWILMTASL